MTAAPHLVALDAVSHSHLSHRLCEFSDRIVFLPPLPLVSGWKAHPVVKELERRIADAADR
jgi:hypothetical protein